MNFWLLGGSVLAIILAVICFSAVNQTILRQRQQRLRMEASLRKRVRVFSHLLDGFPAGFIGKELRILVNRCVLEIYQQLATINPKDSSYAEAAKNTTVQLEQIKHQKSGAKRPSLNSLGEISEAKKCLGDLEKFVMSMLQKGRINKAEATQHVKQIKQLLVLTRIDGYAINAKEAEQAGKFKLAIHHYNTAKDHLEKMNQDYSYINQIEEIEGHIAELEHKLEQESSAPQEPATEQHAEEWDKVSNQDDTEWKKKTVYD